MWLTILLIVCSTGLVSVAGEIPLYSLDRAEEYFEEFIGKYDRQYVNKEEKDKRFEIFKQNLNEINSRNSDPTETAEFGITKFADMTTEEVLPIPTPKEDVPIKKFSTKIKHYSEHDYKVGDPLPKNWDFRKEGYISSVKDHGKCKSSHVFALLDTAEYIYYAKHNKTVDLSVQQHIDCAAPYADPCTYFKTSMQAAAEIDNAFNFFNISLLTSSDYPYEDKKGKCRYDSKKSNIKFESYAGPNTLDEVNIKWTLYKNPMVFTLDATSIVHYQGGIIENCTYNTHNLNAMCVGWGTENGVDYWILKNSWGKDFGEEGYFRLKRNVNACGITSKYNFVYLVPE